MKNPKKTLTRYELIGIFNKSPIVLIDKKPAKEIAQGLQIKNKDLALLLFAETGKRYTTARVRVLRQTQFVRPNDFTKFISRIYYEQKKYQK